MRRSSAKASLLADKSGGNIVLEYTMLPLVKEFNRYVCSHESSEGTQVALPKVVISLDEEEILVISIKLQASNEDSSSGSHMTHHLAKI